MEKKIISKIGYKGFDIITYETDKTIPYMVVARNEKLDRHIKSNLPLETIAATKSIISKMKKHIDKMYGGNNPYVIVDKKFAEKGFSKISPNIYIYKDIYYVLKEEDVHYDDYIAIIKHRDKIQDILEDLKDREHIFYDEINRRINSKFEYVKSSYKNVIYSVVVDSLERKGVDVHS